ncbi:MAG: acyltransferase, partial [Mycobacterium sp.]|nr:acyltransferase [Mycobacterium sp.]
MSRSGAPRQRSASIGHALSDTPNSLNLIRLLLALAVIQFHSSVLGGYLPVAIFHWTDAGSLAVYGFFGISGYLITGSALKHSVPRYLWHRALRIFPAFWICLMVTAVVFGWIGWTHSGHHCGVGCYVAEPNGPLGYVFRNSWLRLNQYSINGTLLGAPIPNAWNGSLWTLFYEFLCYLLIGVLALVGVLRSKVWLVAVAAAAWVTEVVFTSVRHLNLETNTFHSIDAQHVLSLVPVFLAGSVLYHFRDQIPDSGWIAIACVGLMLAGFLVPVGAAKVGFALSRADLVAPLLVYPVLWLGAHLPGTRIGARNDYSYGVYIYAYPVAQLLALWGAYRWGYTAYTAVTVAVTGVFAAA